MRPWVQTPVQPKRTKKKKKTCRSHLWDFNSWGWPVGLDSARVVHLLISCPELQSAHCWLWLVGPGWPHVILEGGRLGSLGSPPHGLCSWLPWTYSHCSLRTPMQPERGGPEGRHLQSLCSHPVWQLRFQSWVQRPSVLDSLELTM
jgi:hypothetical protein